MHLTQNTDFKKKKTESALFFEQTESALQTHVTIEVRNTIFFPRFLNLGA